MRNENIMLMGGKWLANEGRSTWIRQVGVKHFEGPDQTPSVPSPRIRSLDLD